MAIGFISVPAITQKQLEAVAEDARNAQSAAETAQETADAAVKSIESGETAQAITDLQESVDTINETLSTLQTDVFYIGSSAPSNTKLLWVDTANSSILKYYTGSAWEAVKVAWG